MRKIWEDSLDENGKTTLVSEEVRFLLKHGVITAEEAGV